VIRLFNTPNFLRYILPNRVWGISSPDAVYLTFDDGPTESLTKWILDYFEEEKVRATFFLVGENVKSNPELVEQLKSKGHVVGNHTMHHEKATKVSGKMYLDSIKEASKYIDSNLFRPPYGRLPICIGAKIKKDFRIVMWSWISYDYDKRIEINDILKKADRIKAGDILVLHDNVKSEDRLKILLPELIRKIKAKGLRFEVISS